MSELDSESLSSVAKPRHYQLGGAFIVITALVTSYQSTYFGFIAALLAASGYMVGRSRQMQLETEESSIFNTYALERNIKEHLGDVVRIRWARDEENGIFVETEDHIYQLQYYFREHNNFDEAIETRQDPDTLGSGYRVVRKAEKHDVEIRAVEGTVLTEEFKDNSTLIWDPGTEPEKEPAMMGGIVYFDPSEDDSRAE